MNKEKKQFNEDLSLLRRQVHAATRILELKIVEKEIEELKNDKIFQTK